MGSTEAPPRTAAETVPADAEADAAAVDDDEGIEESGLRWVSLITAMGAGLAVVITFQVLAAIAEGMALKPNEPQGLEGDIFHRIGYAFASLGGTALLFLVVAVLMVSLPVILKARTTERQETVAAVTLGLTVVMAVIIGVGSILTVRYNLHLYSGTNRSVPTFVRIQLVLFLLGALGTAAIALFGALSALGLRDTADDQPEPDAN